MPDEPLDEIIITGRRRRPRPRPRIPARIPPAPSPPGTPGPGPGPGVPGGAPGTPAPPAPQPQPEPEPLPNIIVTEQRQTPSLPWNIMAAMGAWTTRGTDLLTRNVPSAFERLLAQPRLTDFERLMAQNVKKKPPIPNIIVTAQRSSILTALQRANFGLTLSAILGQVGAGVLRDVSQRRLEESYAWLMAPQHVRQLWRTPLRVQQPEVIPNIIVTAQRPAPSVPSWSRLTLPLWVFDNFRVPLNLRAPRLQTQFEIEPPNIPRPTRTREPQLPTLPMPVTMPFPGRAGGGTGLTRVGTQVLPSRQARPRPRPQTQTQRQGYCPPPPKCTETKKRKKMRTVCWRKLVKEARDPDKDKEYKWTRIDCQTGREL